MQNDYVSAECRRNSFSLAKCWSSTLKLTITASSITQTLVTINRNNINLQAEITLISLPSQYEAHEATSCLFFWDCHIRWMIWHAMRQRRPTKSFKKTVIWRRLLHCQNIHPYTIDIQIGVRIWMKRAYPIFCCWSVKHRQSQKLGISRQLMELDHLLFSFTYCNSSKLAVVRSRTCIVDSKSKKQGLRWNCLQSNSMTCLLQPGSDNNLRVPT